MAELVLVRRHERALRFYCPNPTQKYMFNTMNVSHMIRIVTFLLALLVFPLQSFSLSGIDALIAVCQKKVDNANNALEGASKGQQTPQKRETTRALRMRLNGLRKALSEVKTAAPGAEKRVTEIDHQLTSLLREIRVVKAQR